MTHAATSKGDRPDDQPGGGLLVLLHGVNLGLLGERPAAHYGTVTLRELEALVSAEAEEHGWRCICHQTDDEGGFVRLIHQYRARAGAMLVNPGAWTHYSYAIHDALELVQAPIGEVHLSDVTTRESWRRVSVISDVVSLTVSGEGPEGYLRAARALIASVGCSGGRGEGPDDSQSERSGGSGR